MSSRTYIYFHKREKKQDITFITFWTNIMLDDMTQLITYEKNIPVKNITFATLTKDNHTYLLRELYESK